MSATYDFHCLAENSNKMAAAINKLGSSKTNLNPVEYEVTKAVSKWEIVRDIQSFLPSTLRKIRIFQQQKPLATLTITAVILA